MVTRGIVDSVLLVCTIAMLAFTSYQTCELRHQTEMLTQQTGIMQADFEARSRPYLAIEDIQVEDEMMLKAKLVEVKTQVKLQVKNYGTLPAEDIRLGSIELRPLLEPTPTPELICSTLENGVQICVTSGYAIAYLTAYMADTYDKILYPTRIVPIEFFIEGSSNTYFQDFITSGKMVIVLNYSSGGKGYTSSFQVTRLDGIWKITVEK